MRYISLLLLLSVGCVSPKHSPKPEDTTVTRSAEYQKEIDELLKADAEIKMWERRYLIEIGKAQVHNDLEAYKFYMQEFINLPRLKLPEWMKSEPGYLDSPSLEDWK